MGRANNKSFNSEWHWWKGEFLSCHKKLSGLTLRPRFFYWEEIRRYYLLRYSPVQAVEKYLKVKVRA